MERPQSPTAMLFTDKVPTVDLESTMPSAPPSEPDNSHSDSEKELEKKKDIESDIGAWLCVLAAMFFLISSYGFMNSLGTVQSHLSLNQLSDFSTSEVGWINGVYLFLSLIFNFQIGSILDRYGPQLLSTIAAFFSTATFLLLAQCKTYWQFMLCLGVFGSIGTSIGAVTAVSVVGKLFIRRRGLAMGIAVMGTSLGSIVYPMTLRATFESLGWAWSMRLVALIVACFTSLGVVCFLPFRRLTEGQSANKKEGGVGLDLSAFKSPKFVFTSIGVCIVEFVVYGIGGLLPTISAGAGFSTEDGYMLISILGACSCVGRFSTGFIGDKVGPFNAMVTTMVIIVILMASLFIPFATSSATLLYIFTALWGYFSGSFYVLSPVCTGKTCEPKDYARYFGSSNMCVAVALLLAIPLSGMMLEKLGSQLLACFYLGMIVLAGISFVVARGLLIGNFFVLKRKM
ncbi:hypothetical protein LCI18_006200 [Fusarium solani-melongenae]|uniref:Uncharacterized protein n=1 Tax=Fusarium solani subsp. cucurbitae TaxID=2747967 RepID=A0ACD3Z248_FUSSC|nr:hypothetical protein LCI18_006200 [Fusarium solani-melongenae]